MTYTLHISNCNYSSWSLRAWVLLRALEIPFTEQQHFYSIDNRSQFLTFSPSALVPCLQDEDITVWESLAIAEYLYEAHPAVWPLDRKARAFARSAVSEMHAGFTALRSICNMNCGIRVELPERDAALQRDLDRLRQLFEQGIEDFGGPYLAGSRFTAGDAFFCPVAFRMQIYGISLGATADAYMSRLLELPAMREWYQRALAETQRSEPHEQSIAGRITADLRAV